MNGFFFDLQRFADWTGNATNGFTYTDSNGSVIKVTGVSSVKDDPSTGATLTLGDTQSISNVRVTITNASGTTNLSPGGFRFLYNSNLYTPNTVGETQYLVETLAQGYLTTYTTSGNHSFRVAGSTTTDGTTTYSCNDYKVTLASSSAATVSATEDGTVTLQVTSGTASNLLQGSTRPSVILSLSNNSSYTFSSGQNIIWGSESGPTIKLSSSLSLTNSNIALIDGQIRLSCSAIDDLTINMGKFTYSPTVKQKATTGFTTLAYLTPEDDNKVSLNIWYNNNTKTFTYDGNTYTVTSDYVTVTEDNEGNIYFSGANEGAAFTVTKDGITYTYTRGKSTWTATYTDSDGSHTKIGQISDYTGGEIPADEWDVSSSTWLSRAHIITDGKLTIDDTLISELGSDSSISILQVDTSGTYDYIDYGKFKKNDDGTYTLEGVDSSLDAKAKFNAITVSGDYSLQFSKEVSGVPITVSGTTFASMDTLNSFSYSTLSGGALSVSSANSVSLISGTLQTSTQTVAGGNYSVSGYGGGTDGLTFSRASSTAPLVVGDIDTGEYFNVNGTDNYTLLSSGLLEESVSTYKLYTGVSNSITLGNLGDGAYITTPTSKVLEIGDNINQTNFVVFDSQTNPSVGYASIYTASGNHTLTTLANANFSAGVSTISLTGGSTTIYKDLIAADTTIATSAATFYVTSNDTFTVDATSTQPKIDGATSITLLNGTINATAGQTIKLGNNTLAISSGDMLVNFNGTTATVQGSVGDTFSINNVNYEVNADTGEVMTFNLGTTDKVTVSGLDVDDIFTYDGTQYSLKGAGFIKGNFSLLRSNASSVQADSLTSSTWLDLTTVTADNSVTISGNDSLTTFIKDDFTQTFGSLAKQGNVYHISTVESDKASLSNISLTSDIQDLSLSGGFVDVTIQAPNSTFKVTDDGGDGYSFNSSANSLSGVNAVSLISGNLIADSNFDVSLYDKTIRAGQSLTINTGTNFNSATIGDISLNEQFSVSGAGNYTLSGAGFFLDEKILRGSKGVDSILLASLEGSNSEWRPVVGLTNNTLAVDTTTATELSLVVDDKSAPTSLFGELVPVTGGYSLNANNGDPWLYPVSVDDTALTLTSDFANATLNGAKSAATFTLASLNADTFSIADGAGGASLAGIAAINQTAGFVVQSDGLKSIVVGNQTINNSNDLPINVSVNGSDATLSAIDINDTFNVNSTEYSRNNLGIFTAEQFLKDSAADASSATLADLNNADKWIYTASVSADGLFNVPPTPSDKGEWLVVNHDRSVRYGTISTISGGFSIAKSNYDSVWGDNTFQISNGAMLSLSSDFAGAAFSLAASNAQFSVAANAPAYTVTDAQNALVSAPLLFQSAGSIAVTNQSIVAANHSISGNQFTLSVQNDNATVGALAAGDSFTLDDKSYTLLTNGRLQSSDDLLWNAATIKTDDTGSVAVDSVLSAANWNGIITTTTDGTLTLNSKALGIVDSLGAAYIVNDATIYGTINKDGYYLTNADNTGSSLSSIIFTASMPNVSLSGDFINVPLHAATNQFKATKADDGFRVNFDGSTLNLDGNAIVDLSSGNLILDESDQTITGGNHSVGSASESVNVSYDGATLTVDDFATAGESLALNSHNYSIVGGDGITLKASDASTIIDGITTGDRFKIDAETFIYTDAGFGKTEANSDKLAYLLKAVNPTDNAMTLADLQSTDENLWLGIYLAESGNVTISNDIPTSVVFVDDLEQPAINYGQAVRDSNGRFVVGKYTGSEAALSSVSDVRNPESILVESGITATIEAAYSQIPVKTNDATSLTFYDSDETAHTLSGTVDKFVPSTMTFTPVKDDSFALDGADYWQAGAGLTRDDSYIWTTAGVSDYVLPGSTWSNLVKLSAGGELTLEDASDGDNVIVDNASSERYATLTKSGSSYDVNSTDGKTIDSIVLEDGDATVTTDFATTISTGEGTYNINGNSYTGDALTIDATASSSTLYKGTVSIEGGAVTATNDESIEVSSGTLTATAEAGKWTTLGELTAGDTFTIAGTRYQVQGTDTLVKLSSSGGIGALYVGKISGGTLSYEAITGDNYSAIIGLNSDNNLDLTSDVGLSSAIVVGQVNGEIDATNRIAKLSYADNSYTLSDAENLDDLNAVLLKDVKEYNSSLATTVKTSGTGTFTINGKEFAAQSDLTVVTEDSGARLTAGEVTLATGASVDTRYGSVDETIGATSGNVNVSVASGAVTISDMSAGDVFSVNGTNYAMTAVGLVDVDNQLNCNAQSSITTADLSGADWQAIVAAPDGDLVLKGAVAGYVADIDLDNPADAKKYGTLTVENGAYTLTQDDDTVLESVDISGVKVTLPAESAKAIKAAGATFAITAQEPYTLDATGDTLKLENVDSVELTDGEITVAQEVPINADGKTITTTNGTLTVGVDDSGAYVGALNSGDKFTVDDKAYRMTAAGLLNVTDGTLEADITETYYIDGTNDFRAIIAVESDGVTLNLTNQTTAAEVYDSADNPSVHMATFSADKLTKQAGGIETINLGENRTLEVDFAATVNASGTTTVNGKTFAGTGDLVIDATADDSTLQSGTITLDSTNPKAQATADDNALEWVSGTFTATAEGGHFTNLAGVDVGEEFKFDKTYTQTNIGLFSSDNKIKTDAGTELAIEDLSGSSWQNVLLAPNGAMTITSGTASGVLVANITEDKSACKRYGTLNGANNEYTLSQSSADEAPLSIEQGTGVKATYPAKCSGSVITAKGATFKVTSEEAFTVDATGDTLKLENVDSVELTAGEITLSEEATVHADGKTITTTNGTLTVGVDDSGAYVGALNSGDEFTVDDKAYKMTAAGLLNVTDGTLEADITETYYIDGTNDFKAIIAVESDGITLNLTNQTTAAEVYDSADNPSVHMATFSADKLTKQAGGIETINLGENRTLEVDFAATVNASGTTTVNGKTFAGTGDLVIDATADDSTLQSGTITLDSTNPKAQATADDNALELVSGTITATAENGHFTKLSGLNVGEEFKFGKTYRQSAAGLISGSTISEELAGETVDLTKLNSATWSKFIAPTDGTLDITNSESALVFDNVESPTKKLAKLTVDDKTTLNGTESATEIKTVEANASDITVDFATRLKVPSGTVTVNGNSYTGTTELQIDSDGTTSTLYEGTVTLNNAAIKATNETSELAAQSGTITAQVAGGKYVTLSDIQNGDTFKLDKPYTRTAVGMMTDGAVIEEINSDTIDVSELTSAEPVAMIAPVDGELDLTNPAKSVVVDNVDSPTIKYANLDVEDGAMTLSGGDIDAVKIAAGADLTVDFATEVNSPIGTVTVNNQNYTGTTTLQIESDGTTSTLTSGTVELASGDSVKTTSGNDVSVQAGNLTVTADDAVTLGDLTAGDEFTADGKSYKVAAAGLLNVGDVAIWTGDDISDGLNVESLTVADNWQAMAAAPNGMLEINAQSSAAVIVDDVTNPTKIYGTLTDDYKLSAEMADSALSGINVVGVVAEIDAELAIIPLTINSTTALTITPSGDSFEVDGTGTAKVDGVDAIEVSAGELELRDGQSVTVAADDVTIKAGTGTYTIGTETFKVTNLSDGKTLTYSFESGEVNEVSGFEKGTTVEIDSTNYVSPRDDAILHYNDEDGWYFDAAFYDEFTVTVDSAGKVTVVPGMRFKDVVASGEELDSDRTLKLAATIPVKVISDGAQDFSIADADDNTLAQNFSDDNVATFSSAGIDADDLTAVSGAEMTLANGQKLTAGDTTITATADDTKVGINSSSNGLSLNKGAEIIAPAEISLTLNAGKYAVNGEEFGASGSAIGTTTADGVKLDIAKSDALTYNGMQLSDAGTATIESSSITVSGGAIVTNTTNKVLTVDGTAYLDEKTINAAEATEVTARALGIDVGDRSLTVTGDEDGYTINLADNDIAGLEEIGGSNGVTVDGGGNATVQTDMAGAFTAEDETYTHSNSEVNYGLRSDKISSISGAGTIVGDFNSARTVNGDALQITGADEVTVISSNNGVKKVEVEEAGAFTVNEKSYEIQDDDSFAFNMSGGEVSGVASVENGTLIIGQDENKFDVNNERLTLSDNGKVTLGIVDSRVASVHGADGTISGLRNATVYDVDNATINGKSIKLSDAANVIVSGGTAEQIVGLSDGATVRSAPNMTVSATNGTYTFVTDEYTLADTLDGAYEFLTDSNSRVRGVDNYAGTISGPFDNFEINGKTFNTTDEATIGTDGENITSVDGIENGGAIDGDLGDTSVVIPEGDVTINGVEFNLTGDTDGASLSGNGTIISGLEKDATLAIGKAGTYEIDGKTFEVNAGDSFTTNRDGVYMIDPNNPPISEKTDADDIIARGENPVYVTESGSVDMTGDKDLALIEGTAATVTAGDGNDSIVVRHGAEVDINLDDQGSTLIIPTAGRVTLENYNGDNAQVQTFDYSNLIDAVKGNSIQFGNGGLDLGDAVIIYDEAAESNGSTAATLINAHGERQAIAFTHMKGGTIDLSDADENYLIKGNYAENEDDTLKGGGSAMTGGAGNDTILAGSRDTVDGGEGNNQIYLTDKALRSSGYDGATLILSGGKDTVYNFASGFNHNDDKISINNINDLEFGYAAGQLVLSGNGSQMTFDNVLGNDETTYELRLSDGTRDTNAAIAKENATIQVLDGNAADVFYGNEQGISFSEYTGAVEVNLNENGGTLDGRGVNFYNIDKVAAGAGDTSLIGAANKSNTLFGGTGNSSIWSNSGKDLMVGNSDENKLGSTRFFYMTGDGLDTITNFDFMSGVDDITQDVIQLDDYSGVTDVILRGSDVMIGINNSTDDYLTLVDAKGKSFRLNDDLIAKVDTNVEYDGFTNCYVGYGDISTLTVGRDMGDVAIWLSDDSLDYHGIMYDGIRVLDASAANGNTTLAGSESDNLIIGGAGANSIWGGYAQSNDTLVGGSGQNTFFFAQENGHDVIQGAHDGDVVSLEDIYFDDIARADITSGGVFIELNDGATLEIQSTANLDYRLQDGTTYTADRTNRQWNLK